MNKTCHVLTSSGPEHDTFCEMTYISAALAKRLYPASQSVILTDAATSRHFAQLGFNFEDLGSVKVVDIDSGLAGKASRSRFLKTKMRQLIDGDFVFLDADALPLNPCDELSEHGAEFAAALDRNREFPKPKFPDWVIPFYDHYGWSHPIPRYYNSGVMFMADTPGVREMAELWHRRWRMIHDEFGVHQDQPSLNHTLSELDLAEHELPLSCNAMVDASPYFSRGAKVIHYFLRGDGRHVDPLSLLAHLIRHLRETGKIDWESVEFSAKRSDAWMHPTRSVHIELATGHVVRALGIAASRVFLRS